MEAHQRKVTAEEVAALLKISVRDAKKKMVMYERKKAGQVKQLKPGAEDILYNPVPVGEFSEYLGVDLEYFIEDIQKNFLVRNATKQYIFHYPEQKIDPEKKFKIIRLPKALQTLLTDEQKQEILNFWEPEYAGMASFRVFEEKK